VGGVREVRKEKKQLELAVFALIPENNEENPQKIRITAFFSKHNNPLFLP
jgi:hypothetical protein